MKKIRRSAGLVVIAVAAALAGLFFAGPPLIHLVYRSVTREAQKQANRIEYRQLANRESSLSGAARKASLEKRLALFRWFHARGWNIDEGDDHLGVIDSKHKQWRELIDYWER